MYHKKSRWYNPRNKYNGDAAATAHHRIGPNKFGTMAASVTTNNGSYVSSNSRAQEVLETLPPTKFAFSYGSAVFPQAKVRTPTRRRMLDLVLAVEDAESWHAENLEKNPEHYALPLRHFGAKYLALFQRLGPRIYYNTLMPRRGNQFKYGVITESDLRDDLLGWRHLYAAGRAHKPIQVLRENSPGLTDALESNVSSAAAAALLTLPESFSEEDVYVAAASLSYTGDVRLEACNKPRSIVNANMPQFRRLYDAALKRLPVVRGRLWRRDVTPDGQRTLLRALPSTLRSELARYQGLESGDVTECLSRRKSGYVSKAVLASLAAIVSRSSVQQSVKGLFTAGISTSARYIGAKLAKSIRSRLKSSM